MNKAKPAAAPAAANSVDLTATVTGLTDDGSGVVRINNKVVFVGGALPGEEIIFRITRQRRKYDQGTLVEIITPSPQRVEPPCEYFGLCGGCGLQHLAPAAQITAKEQMLREQFSKFGHSEPGQWLPPLTGDSLHYRRKARLGVKHVHKKGRVLVGFRERASPYIAEMNFCHTLDARFARLIPLLREMIEGLSCRDRLPQIEVAAGDEHLALIFRHMDPLGEADAQALIGFGQLHQAHIYTQPQGPDSVAPLWPQQPEILSYHLPDFELQMLFRGTDFIQVNAAMNRRMVSLAVELLQIRAEDKVLDLFCGLGNFTLPLARQAAYVVGVEANESLLEHARRNAQHNGIENVEFHKADLYDAAARPCRDDFVYNKLLLDPPRDGALQVIRKLPKKAPERIVYVSCNPVTLARDSEYLIKERGYHLSKAGVMDMFPHTNHVESIALFER